MHPCSPATRFQWSPDNRGFGLSGFRDSGLSNLPVLENVFSPHSLIHRMREKQKPRALANYNALDRLARSRLTKANTVSSVLITKTQAAIVKI
jgi:hypothetical protein